MLIHGTRTIARFQCFFLNSERPRYKKTEQEIECQQQHKLQIKMVQALLYKMQPIFLSEYNERQTRHRNDQALVQQVSTHISYLSSLELSTTKCRHRDLN